MKQTPALPFLAYYCSFFSAVLKLVKYVGGILIRFRSVEMVYPMEASGGRLFLVRVRVHSFIVVRALPIYICGLYVRCDVFYLI